MVHLPRSINIIVNPAQSGYVRPINLPGEKNKSTASCPAWETASVLLLMLVFLAFNLLTASRYPFVWTDEVMYSDPAVNLYLGHGFTSTAWYAQPSNEFWAGNVPLHSALLFLWLKIFGFSITAIRSINFVYFISSCLLLWRACIRFRLITSSRTRLALLALLIGGYSMLFAYRSGRPDCLAMLLVCAAIYVASRERWWQRIFGTLALGIAMPWAGLQLMPLLAVGGILLILYTRGAIWKSVFATWSGAAIGGLALAWFYVSRGVWHQFVASVHQQTGVTVFGWAAHGEFRHSNLIPKDFSFIILFILALALAAKLLRKNNWRSPLSFGLVYSIALTIALLAAGKFPTYYGWMTYLPLSVCLCTTLAAPQLPFMLRLTTTIFFAVAILLGIGLHAITALADWPDRNYANVQKLVLENITPADSLYGDFAAYYAAKPIAAHTYMPLYLPAFLQREKQELTVLVISPKNFHDTTNAIGGNWVSTGKKLTPANPGFWAARLNMGFLSTQNYELEIYRRAQ